MIRRRAATTLAVLFALGSAGCSHGVLGKPEFSDNTADRMVMTPNGERLKSQVIRLADCPKLDGLRYFERALFKVGFTREVLREETPVAFELVDHLMTGDPILVAFRRSDFERIKQRGSVPYHEIVGRYQLSACEEAGGGLYVIVLRQGGDPDDKFLGDRFTEALKSSTCRVETVGAVRDLGPYSDTTVDDLLRHVKRGRCREFAEVAQ